MANELDCDIVVRGSWKTSDKKKSITYYEKIDLIQPLVRLFAISTNWLIDLSDFQIYILRENETQNLRAKNIQQLCA